MGLAERRAMKEYDDVTVPRRRKEIEELAGVPVAIEIDWPSFHDALDRIQDLDGSGLDALVGAFRSICRDDLGKEAVRQSVHKIHVQNVATPEEKSVQLKDGVLVLANAFAQAWGRLADSEIAEALEKSL